MVYDFRTRFVTELTEGGSGVGWVGAECGGAQLVQKSRNILQTLRDS